MELNDILGMAIKANASDVHLKVGLPPVYRIDGSLRPLPKAPRLAPEDIRKMAYAMMSEKQRNKFETTNEVDLAYGVPGMGRFRVNMFTQRGSISMILRAMAAIADLPSCRRAPAWLGCPTVRRLNRAIA